MQNKTYSVISPRKQFALVDSGLQMYLSKALFEEFHIVANMYSMLCMNTFEIKWPFPLLLTVVKKEIELDNADKLAFREQYRRMYDAHNGMWLIIVNTPEQYMRIRQFLPIGFGVYLCLLRDNYTSASIAKVTISFIKEVYDERCIDTRGTVLLCYHTGVFKCNQCGTERIMITGADITRDIVILGSKNETWTQDLYYIPVEDFTTSLKGYAKQVNDIVTNDKILCSLCDRELGDPIKIMPPKTHFRIYLNADDCIYYFCDKDSTEQTE